MGPVYAFVHALVLLCLISPFMLLFHCAAMLIDGGRGGGGSDFLAGFHPGGAVCGTFACLFAPQQTRQTLNANMVQLNSAIDKVSSGLRGGNSIPTAPVCDPPRC
ncbi:hypothetical protein SAY86_021985 [Trapa natans]|uniref:Uncharacterized protein n=1 Tax=Trapa natans TaxID=22666 RepID=A0AAN7RM66_TRANT|nr:hypothetical protein SAY86_021985 [Trapa natans]